MSTYSSHSDFDQYHTETGENCDYIEMKTQMLEGISIADLDFSSLEIDDLSWLDFGDLFEGLVDLITGVFD